MDDRNSAFEEFIRVFADRYTHPRNARTTASLSGPGSLNITPEGLIQLPEVKPCPPCWLRFKKKLTNLPDVKRYKADLALAFEETESGHYNVIVVPRFKPRYEEGRRRPAPRLFKSKFAFVAGFKGKAPAEGLGKNQYTLNHDEIYEPFVVKKVVPLHAFDSHPALKPNDIALFYYGMIDFWDLHPEISGLIPRSFIEVTCQLYLRHPLQIDEKVEAVSGYGIGTQGWIRDLDGTSCSIEVEGKAGLKQIEATHLRRWFKPGDHIKVHFSERLEWRDSLGLVILVEGDLVTVHRDDIIADVSKNLSRKAIILTHLSRKNFKLGSSSTRIPTSRSGVQPRNVQCRKLPETATPILRAGER